MTNITNYFNDGADYQSKAVLAALQGLIGDGIESSWDEKQNIYTANVYLSRWENCREQGYVVILRNKDYSEQLNISWFEHRNSDRICAIKWNQKTINSPTIETAEFGNIYKDKYDISFSVLYSEYQQMAIWIFDQLTTFWGNAYD